MIPREIQTIIEKRIDYKKAIIVLGPRQSGKTTLLRGIVKKLGQNYLYFNGDDPASRSLWDNPSKALIEQIIGDHKVIFMDEAQRFANIGLSIKMIIDSEEGIQIFVSGSSSLELSDAILEPLTGRKWEYTLLPFSWKELKMHYSFFETHKRLEQFLVTGMYPEVVTQPEIFQVLLVGLSGSWLYRVMMEPAGIRNTVMLVKLLQALAGQVVSEVSYSELLLNVGADRAIVSSYVDVVEK